MTAFDRFDLVDARVAGALEELGAASRPDYIDDVLKVTAARRQRPRWTFLERWLPVDTTMRRPMGLRRTPIRALVVLLLLLLAAAVAVVYVGSRPRVPAPFGPAANGQVLYMSDGDIYVRDAFNDSGRLLLSLPGDQFEPFWSPDGQWFSFVTDTATEAEFMVARADGSDAHKIASIPLTGNAQAAWRPDSRAIAFIYDVGGFPTLSVAPLDGSPPQEIDLGYAMPTDLAWRPPDGSELLVRVMKAGGVMDYLTVRPDGTGRHDFGIPSGALVAFGWGGPGAGGVWSPDGSRIAFAYNQSPGSGGGPFRIHLMHADGTGEIAVPGATDLSISENWPLFSPDGQSILINRFRWGTETTPQESWLAVMPADGSAQARDIGPIFDANQEFQLAKSWSPDGTRVLVYQGEDRGALSIDPKTGKFEELEWTTDLPDVQRTIR